MGIFFFAIAYGLIEVSNAIYVYWKDKKNQLNLFIIVFWGSLIVLVSLVGLIEFPKMLQIILYLLFGTSWILLIKTPCSVKLFRINKKALMVRKIIFLALAFIQFYLAAWVN